MAGEKTYENGYLRIRVTTLSIIVMVVGTVAGLLGNILADQRAHEYRLDAHGKRIQALSNHMLRRLETEAGIESPTAGMEE